MENMKEIIKEDINFDESALLDTSVFDECATCVVHTDDAKYDEAPTAFATDWVEDELHTNCTVQILKNVRTGAYSVGWWRNE